MIASLFCIVAVLMLGLRLLSVERKLNRIKKESKPLSNGCVMVPSKTAKECIL